MADDFNFHDNNEVINEIPRLYPMPQPVFINIDQDVSKNEVQHKPIEHHENQQNQFPNISSFENPNNHIGSSQINEAKRVEEDTIIESNYLVKAEQPQPAPQVASQTAPQVTPEPASQVTSQPAPQPAPVTQFAPQPAAQLAPQVTPQSATQPAPQLATQVTPQPALQFAPQPVQQFAPQPAPQTFKLGDSPVQIVCPNCKANILTRLCYKNGLLTWLITGGLCLVGCFFGCCLIPLCVDACKDVEHHCPNCQVLVGTYKRI